MSDDNDIIELGEDGTFEIPSPPKPSLLSRQRDNLQPEPEPQPENEDSAGSTGATTAIDVLESLGSGEYKIFKNSTKRTIDVIVRLPDGESSNGIFAASNLLTIQLVGGKSISIELPDKVLPTTAASKFFQTFITTRINMA
jgi:hypothetical protein